MTVEEVLQYYGSTYRFEQKTMFRSSNFVHWKRKGYIPMQMQMRIERLTNGALKARIEDLLLNND